MRKRGKKYRAAAELVEPSKRYSTQEACELLKKVSSTLNRKFDETINLSVKLGVDPKHADQMIRGAVVLPHGTGKTLRVAVFCKGEKQQEARNAGADFVGAEDLVEKVQGGFLDFDVVIASPDMMALVGRLGRVLGPRGLMPNPKTGTVTPDIAKAVSDSKGGKIEYRTEKAGIIHAPLGKASFGANQIRDNMLTVLEALNRAKPSSAKGNYMQSVTLSTTMSPGIKIDVNEVSAANV
jgi:large subunit ribosomal protein L1